MRRKRSVHAADELRRCGWQAVDAAEAEMAEAFLRGEVTGRPPSAPATADAGRHIVPFAEVLPSLRAMAVAAGREQRAFCGGTCCRRCSQQQMRASSTPACCSSSLQGALRRMPMQFAWLLPSMQGQVCCRLLQSEMHALTRKARSISLWQRGST